MVEHLAVPHTGILSRTAATRPWVAYSWGYEVLMSFAYSCFGILGIGLYGTLLTIAVAYAVYWMLRRLAGQFWVALVLAAITCSSFLFNGMPRPFFFSMVLFCVTLTLLLSKLTAADTIESLYWLPLDLFPLGQPAYPVHLRIVSGGLLLARTVARQNWRTLGIASGLLAAPKLPALRSSASRGLHTRDAARAVLLPSLCRGLRVLESEVRLQRDHRTAAPEFSRIQPLCRSYCSRPLDSLPWAGERKSICSSLPC